MKPKYSNTNKRMLYDSDFHENHNRPWSQEDLIYLCKMYGAMDKHSLSLALGRTHSTLLTMAYKLRKDGLFDHYKMMDDASS